MTEYVFHTLEANLQHQYSFKEFCRKHDLTKLLGLRMDAMNRIYLWKQQDQTTKGFGGCYGPGSDFRHVLAFPLPPASALSPSKVLVLPLLPGCCCVGHPQLGLWFSASFVWKRSQLDYLVDNPKHKHCSVNGFKARNLRYDLFYHMTQNKRYQNSRDTYHRVCALSKSGSAMLTNQAPWRSN